MGYIVHGAKDWTQLIDSTTTTLAKACLEIFSAHKEFSVVVKRQCSPMDNTVALDAVSVRVDEAMLQ